jgi:Zn-dependent M16 (insulinase) family peptidase
MNAMTGADYTVYPFATQNSQDFVNLLSVYVDAAFFPRLRVEDFWQEGHRVEWAKADSSADASAAQLAFKGVCCVHVQVVSQNQVHLLKMFVSDCV